MTDLVPAMLAGLALGAIGSGHCLTMCGPLVLLTSPRDGRSALASTLHAARAVGVYRGVTTLGITRLIEASISMAG